MTNSLFAKQARHWVVFITGVVFVTMLRWSAPIHVAVEVGLTTLKVFMGAQLAARNNTGCTSGPHVFQFETSQQYQQRFCFVSWTSPIVTGDALDSTGHDILGVDCEMAYTTHGLEMVRVTAVDKWEQVVLDEYALTDGIILDYNTRWSGITQDIYDCEKKLSLANIQQMLFALMKSADTILVGHSLDSDLKAMRVCKDFSHSFRWFRQSPVHST